jgi:hypothetical protein
MGAAAKKFFEDERVKKVTKVAKDELHASF